ncbi:MAG: ABC transporter ATP-binding protein [Chloroflexi bacterium]|nr:ABC transporter ATP-binding protein [Chloroflexota bacterium]
MQILVRITKIAWQFRARLILAYLSFLAAIGVSLLIPEIFGEAIDLLVSGESVSTRTLTYFALALLGVSLLRGFLDFARTYCTDSLSQKVAYDIRNRFYDKLQHLSFAYHDKEHTGELMSKATADVEAIRRFVNMGLVRALEVVVRVIALILILSFMNWELTLISLSFVPFIVIRSSIVMGRLRRMWLQVQLRMGEAVTILQENLVGIHVVKAFASEEFEKKKFAKKAQELREEYYQSERLQGTNSAWMTLFFTSGMGLILWYGGWEVIRGNLTEGGLTKFILYLSQLTFPIRMSSFIINSFSRAITSGGRIFDVIDAESPVVEKPDARVLDRPQGRVEFEDVSFAYESRMPALQHLSIAAEPGQITAILGAPGSGKSTIVNLLPRFYDVSEGRITIDGQDIRDFTLESLRHNVGIVQQDVFLFSATIHDNIAYGVKDATREAVIEAATVAQLHDHIDSLPDGYDTWVGERGSTLSGGQRQRLSIARSILTDPPVLILDDSTSSVDVETERMIHRAMVNVMKDRTTFVIAHRLSTVREADLIVVLKDGQIAEQGTHEELLAANSFYRDIYDLQLQPQEELLLDASITPDKEIQTGGARSGGTPRLASEIGDD